ncbi:MULTISPECIES: glycosyltransferase family 2 protein [unclassified Paenibacillus]|uniref:glycosyltransferase family 2 protein n=1 Tax=unclassified Paenibacillus TaxID=185978 RepID=UPI001914F1AE|nr:glycosyltransferase [Paenibacillus sp. EPM92]
MKITKYVFVVLVYRNMDDLEEFINNIRSHKLDTEIIIVNSYYDEDSSNICFNIANKNNCRILNVENKGYGYGNNRGIEYANKHFKYEYLIVSNPDILIKRFDENAISRLKGKVIGPIIKTLSNKDQNPYWYLNNPISEWLIYFGYKNRSKFIVYSGIAINKVVREIFLKIYRRNNRIDKKVFALHGSFVIFSSDVLNVIGLPYDEEMFLFAEEAHLAHLLKTKNMDSFITKGVEVLHKEDGSISMGKIDEKSFIRDSVIKYYEKL